MTTVGKHYLTEDTIEFETPIAARVTELPDRTKAGLIPKHFYGNSDIVHCVSAEEKIMRRKPLNLTTEETLLL